MQYHRSLRVGMTAILLALAFRLAFSGLPWPSSLPVNKKETGQSVRFSSSLEAFFPDFAETPAPSLRPTPEQLIPTYSEADQVSLAYAAHVDPDIAALLAKPLNWDLTAEDPTVLILHTHATESYTKAGEAYTESASWRTLDENYNMLSIGDLVARELKAAGIGVIHDRTLHDRPSYDGSYVAARENLRKLLEANPSICLVLDIHRDAAQRSYGQLRTKAMIGSQRSAQLMLVVGTNFEGYEENLSLALKLHAQLERQIPGLTRPLQLRKERFNQDLSPGSILVEVGAAGNTHPEARLAAQQLAGAVIALARGTAD